MGLYARVSSHDHKPDLERQTARLSAWAAKAGQKVVRVESEIASGMNGCRAKAKRLLAGPQVTTVVVEHKDRLRRMNVELAEAALSAAGRRLVVLDDGEVEDDLVRDMVEGADLLPTYCSELSICRIFRSPHRQSRVLEPKRPALGAVKPVPFADTKDVREGDRLVRNSQR